MNILFMPNFFLAATLNIILLESVSAVPPEYEKLVEGITKIQLENGMKVLFAKRDYAPVFNGQLWVKVGSADELPTKTGAAHLLEHMAFKGTKKLGTKDYDKEAKLLSQFETILDRIADQGDSEKLQGELKLINADLEKLWVDGEFTKLFERRGAKGLNAGTSSDYTMYTVSLPVSELEFWFYMESERLVNPVFRQFYKELEVVKEERRMRTEDSPSGKLYEAILAASYWSHPYQSPTIGWSKDLNKLRKSDAEFLHDKYYRPDNMVAVVVGDLEIEQVRSLAEKYFGRIKLPNEPNVKQYITPNTQDGERIVKVRYKAEPEFLMAYHKPTYPDPASAHLSLLYILLDEGRSSPFQKILVQEKQIASSIYTTERPGDRYDPVFIIGGSPKSGVSYETLFKEIDYILGNLDISEKILVSAKKRLQVHLLESLATIDGLASTLGQKECLMGDWMEVFMELEQIEKTTVADLKDSIKKYLNPRNRTITIIDNEE